MDRLFRKASLLLLSGLAIVPSASAFELLSEGAMGTVSAVSANTVEEIVNVAGPTAAGLTVDDDGYELLPFQSSIVIKDANPDEVTDGLEFALTQEVETWASSLQVQDEFAGLDQAESVGYVEELPPSAFEDAVFLIRDDEFDSVIFDSEDQEEETSFELSRIEQTVNVLEQDLDSIQYVLERKLEFAATIAPTTRDEDREASIGSSYISDLTSVSNVRIATIRD